MTTIAELMRRLMYLLRRDQATADLEEEMRLHLELRAAKLQGGGLQPDSARFAAKRKFGNSIHVQERSRDMWGFDWIDQAAADVRFAIRRLRNRRAFAASTILVAALGIGATTAVFSAVDAAILRPLPFHEPDRLVTLTSVNIPFDPGPRGRRFPERFHHLNINDVRAMPQYFSHAAAFAAGGLNLEDAERPRRLKVGVVTHDFFITLGVRPARGRTFTAEEGKPGAQKSLILSDALWSSQYGRSDMVGKTVMLHGNQYEVIGIMPPRFSFPGESEAWIVLSVPTTFETFAPFRGWLPSRVIARLAPGASPATVNAALVTRWEQGSPGKEKARESGYQSILDEVKGKGATVPLQQNLVGSRRKAFLILLGATALLLLIASANVANLLLSDGAARRREVALREVLGANRGRVVRQLLVESIILALGGALLGLALAPATLGMLRTLMPSDLLGTAPIHIDWRVLGFACGLAIVSGTLFGLWPAFGTSRVDPGEAIKSGGGHGATSGRLGATRRVLITAELALSVMLLIGSGLMLKSFYRITQQELGMNPERAGTLEMAFARSGTAQVSFSGLKADRLRKVNAVLDRLRRDPQIEAVGVVNDLPLRGDGGIGIGIKAIGMPEPKEEAYPRYLIADGGYFGAMGIPLLMGRTFDARDGDSTHSVVISKEMARVFWPGVSPLGRRFYFGGDTTVTHEVVGVVADVREGRLDDEQVQPQMYFSVMSQGLENLAFVARSDLPRSQLLARLTAAVRAEAPTQAVYNVRMMDEVISKSIAPRRTNTVLIAIFGLLALVLSGFGIYAVVSYGVAQRAREFGIRSALGAGRFDIIGLVGREMSWVVGLGLVLGLGAAWALARVISSLLFGVDTHDPAIYIVVPIVLVIPAMIATLLPALRAVRVSPTEVMRSE